MELKQTTVIFLRHSHSRQQKTLRNLSRSVLIRVVLVFIIVSQVERSTDDRYFYLEL